MFSEALPAISSSDSHVDGLRQIFLERDGFNQKTTEIKVGEAVFTEVPSSRKLILVWGLFAKSLMGSHDSDNPLFEFGEMMLK